MGLGEGEEREDGREEFCSFLIKVAEKSLEAQSPLWQRWGIGVGDTL